MLQVVRRAPLILYSILLKVTFHTFVIPTSIAIYLLDFSLEASLKPYSKTMKFFFQLTILLHIRHSRNFILLFCDAYKLNLPPWKAFKLVHTFTVYCISNSPCTYGVHLDIRQEMFPLIHASQELGSDSLFSSSITFTSFAPLILIIKSGLRCSNL